jgi:inhibitor of cysteine peptidase
MLRLVIIVGDVVAIVGLLSACGAEPPPAAPLKRLTEADAGRAIELRVGDELEITLPGKPSAGFEWEVGSGDTSIIKLTGEPGFTPSSNAFGATGQFTLHFEAIAAGQTALNLVYRRPFEKDTPPTQIFEVNVTVK